MGIRHDFSDAFGHSPIQAAQSEGEPMEDSADYGDISYGPLFSDPCANGMETWSW